MSSIAGWMKDRFPVEDVDLRTLTNEPVPNHMKRWWFALGGTPAYLFVVQIFTGILLAFYYEASTQTAYDSVRYITEEAPFGWYIRGVHRWAATLMVAAVILHQMRVYFTGAYRKPREVNWMVGMTILLCTLMLGFTGYSLVFEQLSYWGMTVGANIAETIPLVGGFMKRMLLAGETYNNQTLPRLFVIHAALLPVALAGLVVLHVAIIRMQGVTELKFRDEKGKDAEDHFNFFPDHLYMELILGLGLMILLSFLATVFPPHLGPRAAPLTTPEVIKPEWFFYVAFRWLKLFSATVATLSMGFIVFLMYVWPFVDRQLEKRFPQKELSVWIGIVAVSAIIGLTVWEALVAH